MGFRKFFIALMTLGLAGVFALAESPLEKQQELSSVCKQYRTEIQGKKLLDVYPFFDKKGVDTGKGYLNLNAGKTGAYIRFYNFGDKTLQEAYSKLREVLRERANEDGNKHIILRDSLPEADSEDVLKLEERYRGATCYIRKNENEVWIDSYPKVGKEFVFILQKDGNNAKLYYYEIDFLERLKI
ncbi:hypothetical protein CQA53_11720 [Helicobacter didelphidarum]|uniref:Uncharacterized protein n=1 Tax=Helicobacter didelphidarum TaxID=2040648 RepID=A0A3D8I1E8_9HELI|nr:hypothetical protein [Helicobacter didelphidarum]RDU58960.1 hypothetical protein CQA53_11720 [Helicobacter didelphidarum]